MTRVQAFEMEKDDKTPGASLLMWREFVGNTTLHGLRYVFLKRPRWTRVLWLLLMLTSAGYYMSIVYNAVNKFLDRPMNTIIRTKYVKEIDFPAVTICPLNSFSLRKISLVDNEQEFVEKGLNMTECAATAAVRAGRPCGVALLCCCLSVEIIDLSTLFPVCTEEYRDQLLSALKEKGITPNLRAFFSLYGTGHREFLTSWPICVFGHDEECSSTDFVSEVTDWGMCFTFNSGRKKPVRKAAGSGVVNGLRVMLDAQIHDHSVGKLSEGFQVIVHHPNEYVNPFGGISVGPGSKVDIAISREEVKNLPSPYDTNCAEKKLTHFPRYTREGCAYECTAEKIFSKCGCRLLEYDADGRFCGRADKDCVQEAIAELDNRTCGCEVACSLVRYKSAASYSAFPDAAVSKFLDLSGYNWTEEYKRENLILLQVGYASLSYELREQKAAYDSGAMFGEIGGNMGLFLGCSLLTICEFVDFFASVFLSKRQRRVLVV